MNSLTISHLFATIINTYSYSLPGIAASAFGAAAVVAGIMLAVILSLVGIGFYVFFSIMLYRLAKKHNVEHAWLAWIPILYGYVLGEIAGPMKIFGKYHLKDTGLWLLLAPVVVSVAGFILKTLSTIPILGILFGIVSGVVIPLGNLAVVVFLCLVMYRIFSFYEPKNTTLVYALVSILGVTIPFLFYSILKKPQISEGYDFTF